MTAVQVLNTKGAARRLGCSETWIHKLVAKGSLKAYAYGGEGMLMEHQSDQKRQGQGLYFLAEDLDTYQSVVQRRPRGSKNKQSPQSAHDAMTA